MEASVAHHAQTTWDTVETTIPQTTKGTTGMPIHTGLSIKEETHSTTPRMHLVAETTALFQWI